MTDLGIKHCFRSMEHLQTNDQDEAAYRVILRDYDDLMKQKATGPWNYPMSCGHTEPPTLFNSIILVPSCLRDQGCHTGEIGELRWGTEHPNPPEINE